MSRRLLWPTPWQPGRTLAFAALGTRAAVDLVGAHNLQGLAGATAWKLCNGNIRIAPGFSGQPTRRPIAASTDQGLVRG
jgi:hypothetical protein